MRKCSSLIGQGSLSWLLIGCLLALCSQAVRGEGEDEETGIYGAKCEWNSDCKLGFQCLLGTCACGSSYMFDMKAKKCKKICMGSQDGLVRHGSSDNQYEFYKRRYTNCSYVDNNLELTGLEKQYDLSFLIDIEEVDGYVLVVNVLSFYLHLRNLTIIRGKTLYEGKYSLYVALNHNPEKEFEGLLELQLTSLKEIMAGTAFFQNNNLLCFVNTIRWDDINPTGKPSHMIIQTSKSPKRPCPACDRKCYNPDTTDYHCWGKDEDMCQTLNKKVCSDTCDGRCFGSQSNECCHPQCAAGCTSQKKTDCLTCKNFYNEGECHPFCPKMKVYDREQMRWVDNPAGRYSFGSLCVRECPSYLLMDSEACVIKCPEGKRADPDTNMCVLCDGACPKKCPGLPEHQFLTSDNIHKFKGCTVIEGSLRIVKVSFTGDSYFPDSKPLPVEDLQVLKDIKEITGYLMIQEAPATVRNLSFFSGLEVIHGRHLSRELGLSVLNMKIEWLGLTSLKRVARGHVAIAWNDNLCYVDDLDLSPLFAHQTTQEIKRSGNKDQKLCEEENHVCDSQCSEHGCWGPGPDKCIQCRNKVLDGENLCLSSCYNKPMLYEAGDITCRKCHEQCAEGCYGPGANNCTKCQKVAVQGKNGSVCMDSCPEADQLYMYPDEDKFCKPCDPSCAKGCTGPSTAVQIGGCMTCELAINRTHENGTVHCLPLDQEFCPDGYYLQQLRFNIPKNHPLMKKQVCQPCNPLCMKCQGPGNANCPVCRFFKYGSMCLEECPQYTYAADGECNECHEQCLDCTGPNSTNCVKCKLFKIIHNAENNTFECVEKCPAHLPEFAHDTDPDKPTKTVCADLTHPEVRAEKARSKDAERKKLMTIIIPTCVGVLILGILLVVFGYCWRQRERAKENTVKLTARMTGVVDGEPLTPTDAKPDLSKLRLIRESDLRRGGIIGSGAFGTVYKGFWIPDGENVKIPVAIKILQEGTSPNQNQELLEEARVMASVEHPCCIRILAVCMASQMMLITQLMPLGCLLDYIRKHKEHTGSKSLLNWCTQIARGMSYLEDRGIVHRDLAARNVLVQSAGQVKITDFGLAKLLDYNEEEYHAAGGKMPIKWLALECIQHRIFTHKSDVWSYGVTVWELFTYGSRPYEAVRARDVPDLLEKGERLPQPNICTIDVYMIMIKCWMLDADSRPSFTELAEEFAKMARDPGRFLVIPGDALKKIPSEEIIEGSRGEASGLSAEEGDTLMRLPSYSYDKDDLARHLSVAGDGPEEVMEADDYLQPAPPTPLMNPDNNNIKNPLLAYPGGASNKEPHLIREKRYGHLESAAAARQQRELSPNRLRGDSINGRYSSDPVKYIRSKDEPDGNVMIRVPPQVGNGSVPGYGYGGPGRGKEPERILQLPLDEDDYLQPKSANPKAYLDLVDGKDYYLNLNEKQVAQDPDNYLVPTPSIVPSIFENPEYFEGDMPPTNGIMDKSTAAVAPVSPVSPVSPMSPVSPISPGGRGSVKPKIAPKPKRLTDYYNDISGSRRENRPLLSNSSSNCSNGESAV